MNKQFVIVSALAFSFACTNLFAQKKQTQKEKVEALDEVVITATKFKTSKKNIGKVVYKINQETIKNSQGRTVVDLLKPAHQDD